MIKVIKKKFNKNDVKNIFAGLLRVSRHFLYDNNELNPYLNNKWDFLR